MESPSRVEVRRVDVNEHSMVAPIVSVTNRAYALAISELWTIELDRVSVSEVSTYVVAGEMQWMELELLIPEVKTPHQARLREWYYRRGNVEIDRADFVPQNQTLVASLRSPCVRIRHRKRLGGSLG